MITAGKKSLTREQVSKLISVIDNVNDLALIKLALATGMRRGDIISVLKNNIDFSNNSITFFEHKKNRNHKVYVSDVMMNQLKMSMKTTKGSKWLFPSKYEKKKHVSSKTAWNILNRHLKQANIPQRGFHSLRATCYKLCKEKGWSEVEASAHIGDSIRVAQEHYATPSDDEMIENARKRSLI